MNKQKSQRRCGKKLPISLACGRKSVNAAGKIINHMLASI
jgi:hypothetical protein